MVGIYNFFLLLANLAITSSTALVTSGLKSPIAANQTQKLKWWIPFSVGAAGGFKCQVVVPAGGAAFIQTVNLFDTEGSALIYDVLTASGAFSNAIAAAGNYWIEIEATIVNGDTAGDVDLQVAQNTSNATPLTLFKGSTLEVIKA